MLKWISKFLNKPQQSPHSDRRNKLIFDQIREKYMADFIMKESNSGKYDGKQPIFLEQNIAKSAPVKKRLDLMISELELQNPNKPVVVVEMDEPPDLLLQALSNAESGHELTAIYQGGDSALDLEGELARRKLITLADRISALEKLKTALNPAEYNRIWLEIQQQLASLRKNQPEVIVHNEPEKWLRTAANDADLLLQYLINQDAFTSVCSSIVIWKRTLSST